MITRILGTIALFVVAAALIALSVVNRHSVRLVLDPFNREAPVVFAELPFFWYLLGALILGVLLGSTATWMTQGKWRRMVRVRTHESLRWKGEAERLTRERDTQVAERKKQLALTGTR